MQQLPPQGRYSLQELALRQDDVLKFSYDFGRLQLFLCRVEQVKEEVPGAILPEVLEGLHRVLARLIHHGPARVTQYDHHC